MKIYKFNQNTLHLLLDKKCLISFASSIGAQGPSGLIFAIFEDSTMYYINRIKEECNNSVLSDIKGYVPEIPLSIVCKNRKDVSNVISRVLGAGNVFSITENEYKDYVKYLKDKHSRCSYKIFKTYLFEKYGVDISDIYKKSVE